MKKTAQDNRILELEHHVEMLKVKIKLTEDKVQRLENERKRSQMYPFSNLTRHPLPSSPIQELPLDF